MVDINSKLTNGLNKIFKFGGLTTEITFISYTIPSGSYDDDTTQTITGSVTTSGLLFPVRNKFGSEESLLMEQGKLKTSDKVLYVNNVQTSGNILIDIHEQKYAIIPNGIQSLETAGSTIYQKLFIRSSTTGSLY